MDWLFEGGAVSGLAPTLRGALTLLRVGGAPVMLARGRRDEDADRIQLTRNEDVVVARCHWCAPGEWTDPKPFEGFTLDEVLAMDWRIL